MRYLLMLGVVFMCGACTTTESLQAECADMHERFVGEIACLSDKLESEPSLKNDSFTNEYILSGKVLSAKVQSGQLTEDEARLAFSRKYNQLLLQQQQLNTLSAVQLDTLSPRYTRCGGRHGGNHGRCYDW